LAQLVCLKRGRGGHAILKNYRKALHRGLRASPPRAKRLMAKIGNQAIEVEGDVVRLLLRPREWLHVPLHRRALV